MVQYRKNKKVGPFRLTVSQRGISTSVGAGPVRISRSADGRVRRTVRVPGTGIYDTKIVGTTPQARTPAAAQPNIPVQLVKLFLCLFLLGFILSLLTGSLAVGFGIVGGISVAVLVGIAVWFVVLISRRRQRK